MDPQHAIDRLFQELHDFRKENKADHDRIVSAQSRVARDVAVNSAHIERLCSEQNRQSKILKECDDRLHEIEEIHAEERGKVLRLGAASGVGAGGILWVIVEALRHLMGGK